MARHEFDDSNVDAAIDYLIHQAAEDRAQTRSYSLVFAEADLPPPQGLHEGGESQLVTEFMKALHDRCIDRELPPLDSLVVHVAGPQPGLPGGGYFKVNRQPNPRDERTRPEDVVRATAFWDQQRAECKAWGERRRRERAH